ncbi:MAG: DUF87 domain-containing protein [Candidatus Diapherotrites archaeon]
MSEEIGTVISTPFSPSPSNLEFVVNKGVVHRGQFVEMDYSEGTLVALIVDVFKTNRYFERAESVKEFEASGAKLLESFPTHEWEYLVAKTRPLGVFTASASKRSTYPPSPGTKVRVASGENLKKFLGFEEKGLHLGEVEYHQLPVKLNMSRLLKKHLAVLAMSGAGKCTSPFSEILLSNGKTVKIGELVDRQLMNGTFVEDGVEISPDNPENLSVVSMDENMNITASKITAFMRRKAPSKMLLLKSASGRSIELTPEHLVPVVDNGIKWVKANELNKADYILLPKFSFEGALHEIDFVDMWAHSTKVFVKNKKVFSIIKKKLKEKNLTRKEAANRIGVKQGSFYNWLSKAIPLKNFIELCNVLGLEFTLIKEDIDFLWLKAKHIPPKVVVDENFARLMAYWLAEGHNAIQHIQFTNIDKNIQKDFIKLVETVFGEKAHGTKRNGEILVFNKLLALSLQKLGFTSSSWTKFVPEQILLSRESVRKNFLSAFIDCDGYISDSKTEIEVTLASPKLSRGVDRILLSLGCISVIKHKQLGAKIYQRLFVRGVENLAPLTGLKFLVDYKMNRFEKIFQAKGNPNIDIIPDCHPILLEIISLLNMPQPQKECRGTNNYICRRDNPSRKSLLQLINSFENRAKEIEQAIKESNNLAIGLPPFNESEALDAITEAYNSNHTFAEISRGTGVSATTARRMVRGITKPTNKAFLLAENSFKIQGKSNQQILSVANLDLCEAINKMHVLIKTLGYELNEICKSANIHRGATYEYSQRQRKPAYSTVLKLAEKLRICASESEQMLLQATSKIEMLKKLSGCPVFYDMIKEITEVKTAYEYVYDLSTEQKNFVANNLLIHNSVAVKSVIEELLDRKKEDGRISIIVLDAHGEYVSFAEQNPGSKFRDYSSKTKIVRARDIKIGVPKLSVGLIASIVSGLSAPQKRELERVFSRRKSEMKGGSGPFDLADVRNEILRDKEMKEQTSKVLLSWIASLEELYLFGKTDLPSLADLVKPGQLTVLDFSDIVNMKKKQVIVAYFAKKLFEERRRRAIAPFLLVVEEAHQFAPSQAKEEYAISKGIIETIAREGRKFGASLCLISQRPINLSTTALSQCVSPETKVILADGEQKSIDELKNNWQDARILSCNIFEGKLEKSQISAYLKLNPASEKRACFKISTELGRSLNCTADHPLWVRDKCWIKAEGLQNGDFVAVLPVGPASGGDRCILNISSEKIAKLLPNTINQARLFKNLRDNGLIDQDIEKSKVLALARLTGHIFGDGTLHPPYKNPENQHLLRITYSGSEEDLSEIKKDLSLLGFKSNQKISKEEKISYSNFVDFGRRMIKGTTTYFKTGVVGLWAVLRVLDLPLGNKTTNAIFVPQWILNGDKDIKREFLAAFCGAECSGIRWKKDRFPERLVLPFSKVENLLSNGEIFASQIINLFKEFGVESSLYKRDYVFRKDGAKTIQFIISISRNRKNILQFIGNVNYRYSVKRRANALNCLEYLKWIGTKTSEKVSFWKKINGLTNEKTAAEIGLTYNMNKKVVNNWASMTAQQVRLAPCDNIPRFSEWLNQRTENLSQGLIWDKITEITPIELNDVRDITVPNYHCFFANEFLTHNCNTHLILRVTNPYDLKHIGESSEGIDSASLDMITSLRVGEGLLVGEAVNFPVFFRVRKNNSAESKHEISLEEAAKKFEEGKDEKEKEAEEFL